MTKRTTQRRKTEVRGYRSTDASCEGTAVRTRSRNLCLYGLAPLSLYVDLPCVGTLNTRDPA